MICRRCRANIPDRSVFCVSCGTKDPGVALSALNQVVGDAPDECESHAYSPPPRIASYLIWSIISTLCCCLPLGVVAIIFSIDCKSDWVAGRYESAKSNSHWAFYCNVICLICLIVGLIFVAFQVLFAVLGTTGDNGTTGSGRCC